MKTHTWVSFLVLLSIFSGNAGEQSIVSLRDFRSTELKKAGIRVPHPVTLHLKALGAGDRSRWFSRNGGLFASAWIINAKTRTVVWEMSEANTSTLGDDRSCDQELRLERGAYEVYFAAPIFAYKSWTSHFVANIDHRKKPLFKKDDESNGISFFKGWWSDDLPEIWEKRSGNWGIDIFAGDRDASSLQSFTPLFEQPNLVFQTTGVGDRTVIKQGITVLEPTSINLYALGEGRGDLELLDFGWIVNANTRNRVWEMTPQNTHHAGGADKNIMTSTSVSLEKGDYVLYYVTDDSHSPADWNAFPPSDPLQWGITLFTNTETDKKNLRLFDYKESDHVIVNITKVGDDEYRQEGFALKEPGRIRVYAIGERTGSTRTLVDYGYIMDARTRARVWTMDLDRCNQAGGDSKNVFVDEVITLPKGTYLVIYKTDDSHSYPEWNAGPPFDEGHYGITLTGTGKGFRPEIVSKVVEERGMGAVAQIISVGDDADRIEKFRLDRTRKIRIYAIGEGQKRSMVDYGWIENRKSGTIVWEMRYGVTFHAGGARKNRMVNTTITLERGEYALHYVSDDSHSYSSWNEEPPDDQQYWGITLYEDEADAPLAPSGSEPESP